MKIPITNPATDETWSEVQAATIEDVDRALQNANRAFEQIWRDFNPGRRAEILFAIARLIRENAEEIAQLDMKSIGKPIADARDEAMLGAKIFEYYAGAIGKFCGQTIPVAAGGF